MEEAIRYINQNMQLVTRQVETLYFKQNVNLEKQRLLDEAVSKLHEAQSLLVKFAR